MSTEIKKPEWISHKYGSGDTLRVPGIGDITVAWHSIERDKPGCYRASVFGTLLKKTFAEREEMKAYAIATAKAWMGKGIIALELIDAA